MASSGTRPAGFEVGFREQVLLTFVGTDVAEAGRSLFLHGEIKYAGALLVAPCRRYGLQARNGDAYHSGFASEVLGFKTQQNIAPKLASDMNQWL
jgi:hypothetical protein